ncbi:PIR Superfamily Protein [Plasmodium ovale curtisi]|uniref:PIR Superfamily Protein n=1 Tax=Plasmodium ovale curtisi TaxID=864141 RepID=A0A1A8WIV5_PLAOA|nr:PIR Superfamily Protein [Plasmodium ovale curtisi]SBT03032.1 PIR Superfamily Protein [Plasmodium ovale curtisi]
MLRNFSCHEDMIAAKNALAIQQASRQGLVGIASTRGPNSSGYGAGSSKMGMKPENSYIGTKVGKSVLGIAPIALGASALYKFTPLSPWIRKFSGSNYNITGNGVGDNEFLVPTQESYNMISDGGENYISYQPI